MHPSISEQVLAAINVLYHNDNSEQKQAADKWLEHWQASETAWMQADALLHNHNTPTDALWFCAQTLRTKVQRDFYQLPPAAINSLRDSLMTLLLKHAKGSPPVRTQLCLALASLGVHLERSHWGEGGIIRWLASALNQAPPDMAQPCMLELLHVLPQEAGSHKVAVRPARRRAFMEELRQVAPDALEVLTSCLGQAWREAVLEAFSSWLRLTGASLPGNGLHEQPLVQFALEALTSHECFDKAVDVMCELIFISVDSQGVEIKPDMLPLVQRLFPAVMQLRPRFTLARQRAEAESAGKEDDVEDEFDDDEETVKGMARLFAEVGEAYAPFISQGSAEAAGPVEAMLEVTAYPDMGISSMAANFWQRLTHCLLAAPSGEPRPPQYAAAFLPTYERLINIVRVRVRYPENWMTLTKGEQKDFRRGRMDQEDSLLHAVDLVGRERALQLVLLFMEEAQRDVAAGKGLPWRVVEAGMFCASALSTKPVPPGHPLLAQLLRSCFETFKDDPMLRTPTLHLVCAYSTWLSSSIAAGACQDLLQPLLQLALSALSTPETSEAGAKCVQRLCRDCGQFMGGGMQLLLTEYSRALEGGAAKMLTGQAVSGVAALEDDVQLIIQGVITAACASTPPEQLGEAINMVAGPLMAHIQQALQRVEATPPDPNTPLSQQHPFLLPLFDRLATLFQSVPQPEIVAALLASCWRALDVALTRAGRDERAVERLLRVLRHGLKHSGKRAASMLPLLLDVLPAGFARTSLPAFMYVVSELVKSFGDDPAHDASLAPIVRQLLAASCSALDSVAALHNAPDLVDDTFILAARSLTYCPRLVMLPQLLGPLMDTALMGLLIQQREAFGSVVACLCRLLNPVVVKASSDPAAAEGLLQNELGQKGLILVKVLLAGVAGGQPQARVPEICDVILALLKRYPEQGLAWLVSALQSLPAQAVQPQDMQGLLEAANVVTGGGMGGEDTAFEGALYELSDVCNLSASSRGACLKELLVQPLYDAVVQLGGMV